MNTLLKRLSFLAIICLMLPNICLAQKIGEIKKTTLIYEGVDNKSQIDRLVFKDIKTNNKVYISDNQFINVDNFYTGIPKNSLKKYVGQTLDVELVFMVHLCNEGSFDFPCKDWVVCSINKSGTETTPKKLNLPIVGKINDPDGYVNVREEMNTKSRITGKLEPDNISEEAFYFYPCSDANWLRIDIIYFDTKLKGYIHKSRVKIINK